MAGFTRVHGDLKQVMNVDASSYTSGAANAVSEALTVNVAGPKLDFFTYTAAGELTTDEVALGIQTIQQLATIYIYEYTDAAGTADKLAFAVYPTGAWATGTLDTALQALGGGWAGGATTATATFTN